MRRDQQAVHKECKKTPQKIIDYVLLHKFSQK
jgi:hypothetical protein